MKSNALIYTSKIWLTAVFLAPIIQGIINSFKYNGGFGFWFFFGVIFGGALSAPSIALFWVVTVGLMKNSFSNKIIKLYLTFIGPLLVIFSFSLAYLFADFTLKSFTLSIPYILVVIASVWFYRFRVTDNCDYPISKKVIETT